MQSLLVGGLSPRGRGNLAINQLPDRPGGSIPAWAGEPAGNRYRDTRCRVYPRVGGGTGTARRDLRPGGGLSPRGRGNQGLNHCLYLLRGSIPAWAGEPAATQTPPGLIPVYPRVGGGTFHSDGFRRRRSGLSPRGRGNRWKASWTKWKSGSIPAWAGEPNPSTLVNIAGAVYPRVGGGTSRNRMAAFQSPGLSPRGRGNRGRPAAAGRRCRSIPAWAGEPAEAIIAGNIEWVYPRVGGGTICSAGNPCTDRGLSPRGRGNRLLRSSAPQGAGSIPAWAGEPVAYLRTLGSVAVYPRVGGGTVVSLVVFAILAGLSPRGRGNHGLSDRRRGAGGSIPAWAGEPQTWPVLDRPVRVYPRVGGGTAAARHELSTGVGLSPRGRGNRRPAATRVAPRRSIPAWAGEP